MTGGTVTEVAGTPPTRSTANEVAANEVAANEVAGTAGTAANEVAGTVTWVT